MTTLRLFWMPIWIWCASLRIESSDSDCLTPLILGSCFFLQHVWQIDSHKQIQHDHLFLMYNCRLFGGPLPPHVSFSGCDPCWPTGKPSAECPWNRKPFYRLWPRISTWWCPIWSTWSRWECHLGETFGLVLCVNMSRRIMKKCLRKNSTIRLRYSIDPDWPRHVQKLPTRFSFDWFQVWNAPVPTCIWPHPYSWTWKIFWWPSKTWILRPQLLMLLLVFLTAVWLLKNSMCCIVL